MVRFKAWLNNQLAETHLIGLFAMLVHWEGLETTSPILSISWFRSPVR